MARGGSSRHSDDDDRGVRAFWADQELQWNRRGEFAHHRPEGAGDRVYYAANLDLQTSSDRFRDGRSWTQASAAAHGGRRILASTPLYRDPRAIHRHFNNPNWVTHSSLSTRGSCSAGSTKDNSPYQVFDESSYTVTQASSSWCLGNQPKSYNGRSYSGASRYSSTPTLEYDGLDIPMFSRNFCEEDILDWIQMMDEFFECVSVPVEKQAKLVARRLDCSTSTWWNQLQNKRVYEGKPKIRTWTYMRKKLLNRFLAWQHDYRLQGDYGYNQPPESPCSSKPTFDLKRIVKDSSMSVLRTLEKQSKRSCNALNLGLEQSRTTKFEKEVEENCKNRTDVTFEDFVVRASKWDDENVDEVINLEQMATMDTNTTKVIEEETEVAAIVVEPNLSNSDLKQALGCSGIVYEVNRVYIANDLCPSMEATDLQVTVEPLKAQSEDFRENNTTVEPLKAQSEDFRENNTTAPASYLKINLEMATVGKSKSPTMLQLGTLQISCFSWLPRLCDEVLLSFEQIWKCCVGALVEDCTTLHEMVPKTHVNTLTDPQVQIKHLEALMGEITVKQFQSKGQGVEEVRIKLDLGFSTIWKFDVLPQWTRDEIRKEFSVGVYQNHKKKNNQPIPNPNLRASSFSREGELM